MARINPSVCGMGVNVPASMLPRSSSTPVIMGQYQSVEGVGPYVVTGDSITAVLGPPIRFDSEEGQWRRGRASQSDRQRVLDDFRQEQKEIMAARAALNRKTYSLAPQVYGGSTRVDPVGIAPIIILGLGALGITGGLGYIAGRSGNSQPSTLTGEIGKQLGSGMKWAALGFLAYSIYTGKNPIKDLFKK